jgi:hypothetical protein
MASSALGTGQRSLEEHVEEGLARPPGGRVELADRFSEGPLRSEGGGELPRVVPLDRKSAARFGAIQRKRCYDQVPAGGDRALREIDVPPSVLGVDQKVEDRSSCQTSNGPTSFTRVTSAAIQRM